MSKLTQERIDEIVSQSENSSYIKRVIADNFSGLDKPCSVSLGVKSFFDYDGIHTKPDNDILRIVNMLREKGIDAVPYNSPDAKDIKRFVVDKSGISTPVLSPENSIQAATDIIDILRDNGERVNGYALPKTKDNFTYYSDRKDKTIDIIKNAKSAHTAEKIEENYGCSTQEFISKQLSSLSSLPKVDVTQSDQTSIFSGRICAPFNVIANRRNRDLIYASPNLQTAQGYAKGGLGLTTGDYGFIIEYEATPNQKFYDASEIEIAGRTEAPYETAVFAHQNKLKGVYISDEKNNVYCITDKDGNYLNKEWDDFMKLHEGHATPDNEMMRTRGNTLKEMAEAEDASIVSSYTKTENLPKYEYNTNISAEEFIENNFLKAEISKDDHGKFVIDNDIKFTSNTGLPQCISDIKFKNLTITDLSLPENLDLSNSEKINLESCSLNQGVKLASNATLNNCRVSDGYDFDGCQNAEFKSCSLGKEIKLPQNVKISDTTLDETIDLTQTNLTLDSGNIKNNVDDLLQDKNILSAKKLSFLGNYSLKDNALLPELLNHNVENLNLLKFSEMNAFQEFVNTSNKKIPCFAEQETSSDSLVIMNNVKVNSMKDLGLNNSLSSTQIKFQGDCFLEEDFAERMSRFDYSNAKSLHIHGNPSSLIDKAANLNLPAQTPLKLSGLFSITNAETLVQLQNINIDEVESLWPKDSQMFLQKAKDDNLKLPSDIPLIMEQNGVVTIVADNQSRKELLDKYGSNIGKAIYITPEDFSRDNGIDLIPMKNKPNENPAENTQTKTNDIKKINTLRMGQPLEQAPADSNALQQEISQEIQPAEIDKNNQTVQTSQNHTENQISAKKFKELRGIKAPRKPQQVTNIDTKTLEYAKNLQNARN